MPAARTLVLGADIPGDRFASCVVFLSLLERFLLHRSTAQVAGSSHCLTPLIANVGNPLKSIYPTLARTITIDGDSTNVTDLQEEILDVMNDGDPYTARELAEELDQPRRTIQYNLRQLAECGDIIRKEHSKRQITYRV